QSEMMACGQSAVPMAWLLTDLPWALPGADEWLYAIRGRSFMRHMVRKIMGALLEVGHGRLQPADIPRLISLRDRTRSGSTAPPQGLCLASIEYPGPANSVESANHPPSVK